MKRQFVWNQQMSRLLGTMVSSRDLDGTRTLPIKTRFLNKRTAVCFKQTIVFILRNVPMLRLYVSSLYSMNMWYQETSKRPVQWTLQVLNVWFSTSKRSCMPWNTTDLSPLVTYTDNGHYPPGQSPPGQCHLGHYPFGHYPAVPISLE